MLRLEPTRFSRPALELELPLLLVQELKLLASVLVVPLAELPF